jgi:glycosyltransferase involved in cell wall biosynthesis
MDGSPDKLLVSVITATFNAEAVLPQLIASLEAQTDKDFEWVVADGRSSDKSINIIREAQSKLRHLVISVEKDSGIYDALNRAISISSSPYYLVVGADDTLLPDTIARYKEACVSMNYDLLTAKVKIGGKIIASKKPGWLWLYGAPAKISSHSVGLLIKKSLHDKFDFYSLKYQIYSDGFFMLKALKGGAKIKQLDFCAGQFSSNGTSNRNHLLSFTEQLRAQIQTGSNLLLQLALFCIRVIKWRTVISKSATLDKMLQ